MLVFLLLILMNDSDYPDWFLSPPKNSIAVIVEDQYTFESRFISLYLRANDLLKFEKTSIRSIGYEAYIESNVRDSRNDKFKIEYEFSEGDDIDLIDRYGYKLTKVYRKAGDIVFGLFEKRETSNDLIKINKNWLEDKSTKNIAVGVSSGKNYSKLSNWQEAFEHALFQLTMNNNVMILSDTDQRTFEDGSFKLTHQTNNQLNIVKYLFKGIRVSNRYYDQKENVYYLKLKVKGNL